jgi:hypothetical protein
VYIITPPQVMMEQLLPPEYCGPDSHVRCACGHVFWADAIGEENMFLVVWQPYGNPKYRRYLIEQCPKCGCVKKGESNG